MKTKSKMKTRFGGQEGFIRVGPEEESEGEFAPPFFSKAEQALMTRIPNATTPEQVMGALRGAGVKQEELQWLDLEGFLKGKTRVTKGELLDYVKANNVQVQEVVKGAQPRSSHALSDLDEAYHRGEISRRDYYAERENINRKLRSATKFEKYQLPGGTNYRELLLTIPQKVVPESERTLLSGRTGRPGESFQSPHFDEPNVLAHVRFNDRVDAQGKKVLFLEEVQSDWHQEGRAGGYSINYGEEVKKWGERHGITDITEAEKGYQAETGVTAKAAVGKVPNAPFKKSWHELVMKRMLRYAAEHVYDKLAWTTGEQQASRYDLSKQIESIEARQTDRHGYYYIKALGKRGEYIIEDAVSKDKLPNVVGKELAEKILKQPNEQHVYSGLDLKVGGEGMKGFYDQILPRYMNDYSKRWGGRVSETSVPSESEPLSLIEKMIDSEDQALSEAAARVVGAVRDEGLEISTAISRERAYAEPRQAARIANALRLATLRKEVTVHSLDITPTMKRSVLYEGQPLFAIAGATGAGAATAALNRKKPSRQVVGAAR